jgi:pyruvate dehydrogenase E2 component (dihydrolipoamide acetyltransferase)
MRVDVVMPKMGESVQEGKIIRWVKRVGERVEQDETLLEISTDKVDTEIPAPASGVLAEILAPEGETVPVGTVIARIEVEVAAEGAAPAPEPEKAVEAVPAASVEPAAPSVQAPTPIPSPAPAAMASAQLLDVVMPKMGESVQEGKIIRWVKRVGERVEQDETLLEISTDKVDTEIPAPASGVLAEILAPEGETVPVGTVIARIAVTEGAISTGAPTGQEVLSSKAPEPSVTAPPSPVTPATIARCGACACDCGAGGIGTTDACSAGAFGQWA